MAEYSSFTRDAAVHLLKTSPWLGNGYDLVSSIPVSILPANGGRLGNTHLTPEQLVDAQISGHLVPSHLTGTFELRQVPSGWDDLQVSVQKKYTAIYPEYETVSLADLAGETSPGQLSPQSEDDLYETLTSWSDLLYPEGSAVEAGTATSIGGSGSDPGIVHSPWGDPQALVSTYIGNPWVGSDFVNGGPFVVDESKMYREETYKDGKVIRNGEVVVEGSYTGLPDTFTASVSFEGLTYVGDLTKVSE